MSLFALYTRSNKATSKFALHCNSNDAAVASFAKPFSVLDTRVLREIGTYSSSALRLYISVANDIFCSNEYRSL